MGRIGWADAHARRRVGDRATYRDVILDPLRTDLLERSWLTERYDCSGSAIRAPYYHEYPELVAMLLREVSYGIELGLGTVTIDPFERRAYSHHVGDVDVDYSAKALEISLPGSGERAFDVHGLTANARYVVVVAGSGPAQSRQVRADVAGTLRFSAPVDPTSRSGSNGSDEDRSQASATGQFRGRARWEARRRLRRDRRHGGDRGAGGAGPGGQSGDERIMTRALR